MNIKIPIETSARHVHLSWEDLEALFGKGYQLKKMKNLSQPREFAAKEEIDIEANKRKILGIRILGPIRRETQVELSHTDLIYLRLKPMVKESGDIKGTSGALLIGPKGKVKLKKGVINAWRHIHCNPGEAERFGLKNRDLVLVRTKGICSVTFHNVRVRVNKNYRLAMHVDSDEGNAACIPKRGEGFIVKT